MHLLHRPNTRALLAAGLILGLAACTDDGAAHTPRLPALPTPEQDTCRALAHAEFIGQPVAKIEAVTVPADAARRILRPNQPVTMDYLAMRLNVELDANDTVIRLSCG